MKCEQAQEKLSEYLEGSLDPVLDQEIKEHLLSCSRCQAEIEALVQTIHVVASLPPLDLPSGFSRRIMASIREEAEKPNLWKRLFFPIRIKIPIHVVTLLLVSGLAIYLYQANKPITSESESLFKQDLQEKESAARPEPSVPPSGLSKKKTSEHDLSPRQDSTRLQSDIRGSNEEAKIGVLKEEKFMSSTSSEQARIAKEGVAPAAPVPKQDKTVYYELSIIPKEPVEGMEVLAQKLENLVKKVAGEYIQPKKKNDRLKRSSLLEPETLWFIIPEDRYGQFKVELASLGKIESESKQSALMPLISGKESSSVSDDKAPSLLQIKLTVLPPQRPEEVLPTDKPAQ